MLSASLWKPLCGGGGQKIKLEEKKHTSSPTASPAQSWQSWVASREEGPKVDEAAIVTTDAGAQMHASGGSGDVPGAFVPDASHAEGRPPEVEEESVVLWSPEEEQSSAEKASEEEEEGAAHQGYDGHAGSVSGGAGYSSAEGYSPEALDNWSGERPAGPGGAGTAETRTRWWVEENLSARRKPSVCIGAFVLAVAALL